MDLSHVILDLMNRVTELERVARIQDERISYLLTEVATLKDQSD